MKTLYRFLMNVGTPLSVLFCATPGAIKAIEGSYGMLAAIAYLIGITILCGICLAFVLWWCLDEWTTDDPWKMMMLGFASFTGLFTSIPVLLYAFDFLKTTSLAKSWLGLPFIVSCLITGIFCFFHFNEVLKHRQERQRSS